MSSAVVSAITHGPKQQWFHLGPLTHQPAGTRSAPSWWWRPRRTGSGRCSNGAMRKEWPRWTLSQRAAVPARSRLMTSSSSSRMPPLFPRLQCLRCSGRINEIRAHRNCSARWRSPKAPAYVDWRRAGSRTGQAMPAISATMQGQRAFGRSDGQSHWAMRSPIMIVGRLVLARGISGMIDASAIHTLSTPRTRPFGSHTPVSVSSMAQLPTG